MKRSILMLVIALSSAQLFAQNRLNTAAAGSVAKKQDTVTVYVVDEYERSRLDGLLLQMKDFEINADGSITHKGQAVKGITVNGRSYSRLNTTRALTIFPSNMIRDIEIIDVRNQTTGETDRLLNVVTKTNRKDQFADIMVGEGIVRSLSMLPMSRMRMDDIADAQYAIYPPRGITFGPEYNAFGDPIPPRWARQAQGITDESTRQPRARGKKQKDPVTNQ